MSLAPIDLPAPPAAARSGQIETDTFCTGCNYNLHGQIVTLDERLGFLVCRCPECGRFHPAGVNVSSNSLWLRRWSSALLLSFVLLVLAGVAVLSILMFVMDTASVDVFTHYEGVLANGTVVQPTFVAPQRNVVPLSTSQQPDRYAYLLYPMFSGGGSDAAPGPSSAAIFVISGVSLLLGLLLGWLLVTLLWHWPRPRYFLMLPSPIVPALLLGWIFSYNHLYDFIRAEARWRFAMQAAIQTAGIFIGIKLGRSMSRTLVRVIIPPKPRQALAYLWTIDGKTPPAAGVLK